MERNKNGRRGNVGLVNGISRRRPRSASLRDSPEEDGSAKMMESDRFWDRGSKKERDRDRSSQSKRRRGDRREEGEESTDESIDKEEDDGHESGSAMKSLPSLPPFSQSTSPAMVALLVSHNLRKIFPSKVMVTFEGVGLFSSEPGKDCCMARMPIVSVVFCTDTARDRYNEREGERRRREGKQGQ
ncbi:uncharacterized protein LOC144714657 [Wolffia australiana]